LLLAHGGPGDVWPRLRGLELVEPKPAQWRAEYGAGFTDAGVAAAYRYRPPYPRQAIQLLVDLAEVAPRTVLDVGCGTGDLARRLAGQVDRVDAVDASEAMLAVGRQLPGGDHPRLRWQRAAVGTARLTPPYALVVAGESLRSKADAELPPMQAREKATSVTDST
jgi:SAM-dependent methyltransferase